MRYSLNVETVSSGSQFPVSLKAFSPASTSFQAMDLPCFLAAASMTSRAAGQMSTPVPSPSMNGMMGSSETFRTPSPDMVILSAIGRRAYRPSGTDSLPRHDPPHLPRGQPEEHHREPGQHENLGDDGADGVPGEDEVQERVHGPGLRGQMADDPHHRTDDRQGPHAAAQHGQPDPDRNGDRDG